MTDVPFFQGTSQQQHMKTLMTGKQSLFKKKWKTFNDHVEKYNTSYPRNEPLVTYTLDQMKGLPLDHSFWDFGHLTHPDEKWAVDKETQRGIEAYRLLCRCKEELRRISQEIRRVIKWSLITGGKIQDVLELCETGQYIS